MKDNPHGGPPTLGGEIHGMNGKIASILDWLVHRPPDNSTKAILDALTEITKILTAMAADIHTLVGQGGIPPDPPITGLDIKHGPVTTE
jgi:hypothetical protein